MDQRIMGLLKSLDLLGYRSFQIKLIIREAIGVDTIKNVSRTQYLKLVNILEEYEQLGSTYKETYSK